MESVSRISSLIETARDLTLEAARDVGPRKSTRPLPAAQIKKLLDSRAERDILDGLRRVIAMQYATPPQPTLTFFPAVLKTLSTPFPSTRPLVYNYLLHHAHLDPDTALLSINTIQKSLSDSNPRVRAMALKTMSGIRVPVISQIVSLAIKKGVSDLSPIVRKTAALACIKCVQLDPSTAPQVEEYLKTLLADDQYYVAGAAVQSFLEVCPERLELIHPVYRKLCKMVVDMDEWSQLALIRLMIVYARKCFPTRTRKVKRHASRKDRDADFYEELEPDEPVSDDLETVDVVEPDLELFLDSIKSLLSSRNSAVVVAVTRTYLYLSPERHLGLAIAPLTSLLRSPEGIRQVALYNIVQICLTNPDYLAPYFRHFLIRSTEGPLIWRLKLEALSLVFPKCPSDVQDLILAELEHFAKGNDPELVRESVRALGRCAQSPSVSTSRRCLSLLLKQIHSADSNLVGEAMEVIRHLIQRSPDQHKNTVVRLAKHLDTLTSKTARASIIWLVGEFAGSETQDGVAADVLRILIKGYAEESDEVRAQIILLAAKVYLRNLNAKKEKNKTVSASNGNELGQEGYEAFDEGEQSRHEHIEDEPSQEEPDMIDRLYEHAMLLARYTPSYDLRDRARFFRALLGTRNSTELASLLLFAPKPVPQAPFPSESRKGFLIGSASLIACSNTAAGGLQGYDTLPEWVEEGQEPDPILRDAGNTRERQAPDRVTAAGQRLDEALLNDAGARASDGGKKTKTLDAWLDESEEEDEESDDESSESSYESDSEEEESEEEDDSGEDDEQAGLVRK